MTFPTQRTCSHVRFRAHIDARAALAVQAVQATETLFATRTIGQVALARLRDHALGHDRRAHGFVARVADARESQQRADDGNEEGIFHLGNAHPHRPFHMRTLCRTIPVFRSDASYNEPIYIYIYI